MSFIGTYKAREFNLSGLQGISDETLEMHFKLYEGYVKETNKLSEKIQEFIQDGKVDQDEMPAYSELTRRLGFEFNGMVLHEYYFENLQKGGGTGDPAQHVAISESRRVELWQLRHLESRFRRHRQDARRGLGYLLRESGERPAFKPLDHVARDRQCRRLQSDPGDGCLGACLPARLQTGRAAEVYRGVLFECRLDKAASNV